MNHFNEKCLEWFSDVVLVNFTLPFDVTDSTGRKNRGNINPYEK